MLAPCRVGGESTVAVGVHQVECDGIVRRAGNRIRGDRLFADRGAGGLDPLLPLVGALWLVVGMQQEISAGRAAAMLCL